MPDAPDIATCRACGREPTFAAASTRDARWVWMTCRRCGASGGEAWTVSGAIEQWNAANGLHGAAEAVGSER